MNAPRTKVGKLAVGVALLAGLASLAMGARNTYTECQSACNSQYQKDYRACRSASNPTACRATAWAAWNACFYSCPAAD